MVCWIWGYKDSERVPTFKGGLPFYFKLKKQKERNIAMACSPTVPYVIYRAWFMF